VLDYGIPDFSSLSPHNADDHRLIESIIGQAIAAYEPRLRQVRVRVEQPRESERAIRLTVEGMLVIESITESVSFPVRIDSKTGAAEVQENE
jgi:type VI secretion system protein ImpF